MTETKDEIPFFFSTSVIHARRFYMDVSSSGTQELAVISGGCEESTEDYVIDRQDFPYYSIEFVARGRGRLVLQDKQYKLFPGILFSYGPGISQKITTDPTNKLVKYFVDFTGPRAKKMLEMYAPAPGTVIQAGAPEAILKVFDDIIHHGSGTGNLSARICSILTEYLILTAAQSKMPIDQKSSQAFSTYQYCREYIRENCQSIRSQQEIADACNIDPGYLCRLFRKFDNQSPYKYLIRLKMNAAAKMLQKPGSLVKGISYELGFSDPFHFSRTFKKIFGMSPNTFRRLR